MAEALYRKYRPQIFEDVVGQEHIERTLKNALRTDKVSHAYLFTGPRGTGKTTTARLLAKALICEKGPTPDPDGTCEDCELIAQGEHPDVYELDAASRTGVENVREEIIGRVNYAPTRGRYKVYIIDEVHMLSVAAFNALLKTLEEPPAHVVFILCTTDPQKVPETILSRCQRFDFRRISSEEIISRLGAICAMEGVQFEGEALDLIAHRAQGGMRDALTSLEQLIAFEGESITTEQAERLLGSADSSDLAEIVEAIGKRDAQTCFRWTNEYMETGADLAQFSQDLAEHIRDMYIISLAGADVALDITDAARRELESELPLFGPERLARLLCVLGDLISELKTSTNQRLTFEIALTRMIRPESDLTLEALAERIEALERRELMTASVVASPQARAQEAPKEHGATEKAASTPSVDPALLREEVPASSPSPDEEPSAMSPRHESAAGTQDASTRAIPAQVSVDASNVEKIWQTALAHLKKISQAYVVLFMNTRVSFDEASSEIVIAFDPKNEFAFRSSQKPEQRDALRQALDRAGAAGVGFKTIKSDVHVAASGAQPSNAARPVGVQPDDALSVREADASMREQPGTPAQKTADRTFDEAPPFEEVPLEEYADYFDPAIADMASASVDAAPTVGGEDAEPVATSAAPSAEASSTDLNEMLQVFGEGLEFEEV